MEERFVERKKCKRGQAKTKTRIKKKTKAQTKGCGENKKHGGEREKKVATSNWKEIADMDYVKGVG